MLTILFLLCLGQLLAVGVHVGTWWLRARAPGWIWSMGLLTLLMSVAAFYVAGSLDGYGDMDGQFLTDQQFQAQKELAYQGQLELIRWTALFCFSVAALGLYHSFLTDEPWEWPMALGATVATWGEIGVGLCLYVGLLYPASWLRPQFLIDNPNFSFWPSNFFAATLLALALFRPLALKVTRDAVIFAQSKRGLG